MSQDPTVSDIDNPQVEPEQAAETDAAKPEESDLKQSLAQAQAQIQAQQEQVLRAKAELENAKRRAQRDVEHAHKFALEKFGQELLPILDSLEQGLQVEGDNEALTAMRAGIELTLNMFIAALEKFGMTQLNPEGELFNPEHHEAMSMIEMADKPNNTVINVFQKGYLLNGRLVRPARVVVSKGGPAPTKIDEQA